MLGKIEQAQADLGTAINALALAGEKTGPLVQQLQILAGIQRLASSAGPSALSAMRSVISGAIDRADAAVAQARDAGSNDGAQTGQNIATHQAITSAARDYYGKKLLDPYLQFSSAQDEEEYRKREAINRAQIERELAKGTPEGDQRARDIMHRQLMDAKDHGADRSPDFASMLERIDGKVASADAVVTKTNGGKPPPLPVVPEKPATASDISDVRAALAAAGVIGPPLAAAAPGHGVPDSQRPANNQRANGIV